MFITPISAPDSPDLFVMSSKTRLFVRQKKLCPLLKVPEGGMGLSGAATLFITRAADEVKVQWCRDGVGSERHIQHPFSPSEGF